MRDPVDDDDDNDDDDNNDDDDDDDQDASRLHLVPSALQRPLDHRPALKAQPVWEVSEVRPRNRWTNVQSITGIGLTSQSLNTFSENFNTILEEASNLTEELDESWTPVSTFASLVSSFFVT